MMCSRCPNSSPWRAAAPRTPGRHQEAARVAGHSGDAPGQPRGDQQCDDGDRVHAGLEHDDGAQPEPLGIHAAGRLSQKISGGFVSMTSRRGCRPEEHARRRGTTRRRDSGRDRDDGEREQPSVIHITHQNVRWTFGSWCVPCGRISAHLVLRAPSVLARAATPDRLCCRSSIAMFSAHTSRSSPARRAAYAPGTSPDRRWPSRADLPVVTLALTWPQVIRLESIPVNDDTYSAVAPGVDRHQLPLHPGAVVRRQHLLSRPPYLRVFGRDPVPRAPGRAVHLDGRAGRGGLQPARTRQLPLCGLSAFLLVRKLVGRGDVALLESRLRVRGLSL